MLTGFHSNICIEAAGLLFRFEFWRCPMSRKWIILLSVIAGSMFAFLAWTAPAHAQEPTPTLTNDANCVACHEHRYYLYDSGKWFCLCDAPMHCVYCHGGRTDTQVKEQAHEGLVLYPTRRHAERCQSCHTEDYMERVVTFGEVAGLSPTPQAIVTATPAGLTAAPVDLLSIAPLFQLSRIETWQRATLSVLAIALLGVIIFGFRCWKVEKLH